MKPGEGRGFGDTRRGGGGRLIPESRQRGFCHYFTSGTPQRRFRRCDRDLLGRTREGSCEPRVWRGECGRVFVPENRNYRRS